MGLNDTISADRLHIGFFGMRNAGKSSVVNAVTGQDLAVVSAVKGTTTDPVRKAMELLPLGPVMIVDTPGLDDEGELGQLRIQKTKNVLAQTDIGILVVDGTIGLSSLDKDLIAQFKERNLPYLLVWNKADLLEDAPVLSENDILVSAATGFQIELLKNRIGALSHSKSQKRIVSDLLTPGDIVVLVVPIDSAAPKGRLILPQQQTIRDILDAGCIAVTTQDDQLVHTLNSLKQPPRMVITDSQIFEKVSEIVPREIPLTSFSILFARYKGELTELVRGCAKLSSLKNGDRILISEGCTHHRQCGDIGTDKMPAWIQGYTGKILDFSFTSGGDFPENLSEFSLVVHCGGCMLKESEMMRRISASSGMKVPMVNYGIAIAEMNQLLDRSLELFPQTAAILHSGNYRNSV